MSFIFTGETGIGKSTLMDTLFNTHFDSTPSTHDLPGVKLKANTYGRFAPGCVTRSITCLAADS